MEHSELISLLKREFPHSIAGVLTGSQRDNKVLVHAPADIDVVLFDLYYSDMVSIHVSLDDILLDCTIVPVFDIDNVINYSVARDPKRIFLTMIQSGNILFDTDDLAADVKEKTKDMFVSLNIATEEKYKSLLQGLDKTGRYLQRDLDPLQRFILMAGFVDMVTNLELIRLVRQPGEGLRKISLLRQLNPGFAENVYELFQGAVQNDEIDNVVRYIGTLSPTLDQPADLMECRFYSIEFRLRDSELQQFLNKMIDYMALHTTLKDSYRYSFLPVNKYNRQHRRDICICVELPVGLTRLEMAEEISRSPLVRSGQAMICEVQKSPACVIELHAFRQHIDRLNRELKDGINCMELAHELCVYVKHGLRLSIPDVAQMNEFLLQRWIMERNDLLMSKDIRRFAEIADHRKSLLVNERKFQQSLPDVDQAVLKKYQDIVALTMTVLKKKGQDSLSILPFKQMSFLNLEDTYACQIYFLLIPEILMMLNINDVNKCRCIVRLQLMEK